LTKHLQAFRGPWLPKKKKLSRFLPESKSKMYWFNAMRDEQRCVYISWSLFEANSPRNLLRAFQPPGQYFSGFLLRRLAGLRAKCLSKPFHLADSLLIFCFGITVSDYPWLFWIKIMHDPSTILAKRAPAIVVIALSKRRYWTHPPIRLVS